MLDRAGIERSLITESSFTKHSALDGRGMKGDVVSEVVPFLRHRHTAVLSALIC